MKKAKIESEFIDKKAEEYKKDFEGLSEKQKEIYAYKKIFDLGKKYKSQENLLEEIKNNRSVELEAIIKASNCNLSYFNSAILWFISEQFEDCKETYKEALISYNKVLENYKSLARELHISTSLDLSYLFTYMLWNGYYSVNKTHNYNTNKKVTNICFNLFNVIKGGGVCLEYSEVLQNYLTVCEKKSAILQCRTPKNKKDLCVDYRPEIKRNNNSSKKIFPFMPNFIINKIINIIGNHAVVLIEENNKIFIYDPTNMIVLRVVDENTASNIVGKGDFELKPLSTLILQPHLDPNQLLEKLLLGDINQESFSRKEIIFGFENVVELINNNLPLLDDAYFNIHSELELIDKQIDEIGNALIRAKKLK